eukprot:Awhi_evm2s3165
MSSEVCVGTASVTVAANFNWSNQRHPGAYVSSAHWSPLVVAAHGDEYVMWRTGEMAGAGVEQVAET